MEDPVREIPHVISLLLKTPPSLQRKTIERYFTPNAQFTHPFCRTGTFSNSSSSPSLNSRYLIARIYRWYKIMSPRISAEITSICFDEKNMVLYVGMSQVFAIWAVPTHRSEVSLVTVLHLTRDYHPDSDTSSSHQPKTIRDAAKNGSEDTTGIEKTGQKENKAGRYYITSQNDLYQPDQFIKFVLPWLWMLVPLWQIMATLFCVLGSYLFWPVTWLEEHYQDNWERHETPPKWNDAR